MNYLKTPTLNKHAPINTVSRYMKQNWPNLFNPEVIEKMDQKKKKNPRNYLENKWKDIEFNYKWNGL